MANEIQNYYPELGSKNPDTVGEVRSYGSKHTVKSPIPLKTGRGVLFVQTYKSSDLADYPAAQAKVGWHQYLCTSKGLDKVREQITLSREVLLD